MKNIKIDSNLDSSFTSFHNVIIRVPAKTFSEFMGKDFGCDEYKVSKSWNCSYRGEVFTIYDWKETSLYDERLPSPEKFWGSDHLAELHIGSRSGAILEQVFLGEVMQEFLQWSVNR